MDREENIMTLAQAHQFLGVSEKTLRNYCKAEKLPFHYEKNMRGVMEYRFRKADLMAFIEQRAAGSGAITPGRPLRPSALSYASALAERDTDVVNSQASGLPVSYQRASRALDGERAPETERTRQFIEHLQTELSFLKEQLQEKDRQIAAKDKQLERQSERISDLSATMAEIARAALASK